MSNNIRAKTKIGMEYHFTTTVKAYDHNASVIDESGSFLINTKTDLKEIQGWTCVESAEEIFERKALSKDEDKEVDISWNNGGYAGNIAVPSGIVIASHNPYAGYGYTYNGVPTPLAQIVTLDSILSSHHYLPDITNVQVVEQTSGVLFALFDLSLGPNLDLLMSTMALNVGPITICDLRTKALSIIGRLGNIRTSSIILIHQNSIYRIKDSWYDAATHILQLRT